MRIRYDATAIQAKVTDAIGLLNRLKLPETIRGKLDCPWCGPVPLNGRQLAEHIYRLHDGPEPGHFAEIEAKGEPAPDPAGVSA